MAPARLVFAWLLLNMRMFTLAVNQEPEEESELTPAGMEMSGVKQTRITFKKSLRVIFHIDSYWVNLFPWLREL